MPHYLDYLVESTYNASRWREYLEDQFEGKWNLETRESSHTKSKKRIAPSWNVFEIEFNYILFIV